MIGHFSDFSLQIIKRLLAKGGHPFASAIYTVLNESEAIRLMVMAPSKALSHVRSALQEVSKSSEQHGLPPTTLFYTDSPRLEEPFLKNIFPAIKEKSNMHYPVLPSATSSLPQPSASASASASTTTTIAPEANSHPGPSDNSTAQIETPAQGAAARVPDDLPVIRLPEPWRKNIHVLKTASDIEAAANIVNDAEQSLSSQSDYIVIGLDAEWPVNFIGLRDKRPGKTAVIQWAFHEHIYIAQVRLLFFMLRSTM